MQQPYRPGPVGLYEPRDERDACGFGLIAQLDDAPSRAIVDRAVPKSGEGYQRLVYLFSGHDPDAVAEAREAWKALREGNDVTYWQQDSSGRWAKKG